jgi:hypothetical protein
MLKSDEFAAKEGGTRIKEFLERYGMGRDRSEFQ